MTDTEINQLLDDAQASMVQLDKMPGTPEWRQIKGVIRELVRRVVERPKEPPKLQAFEPLFPGLTLARKLIFEAEAAPHGSWPWDMLMHIESARRLGFTRFEVEMTGPLLVGRASPQQEYMEMQEQMRASLMGDSWRVPETKTKGPKTMLRVWAVVVE